MKKIIIAILCTKIHYLFATGYRLCYNVIWIIIDEELLYERV